MRNTNTQNPIPAGIYALCWIKALSLALKHQMHMHLLFHTQPHKKTFLKTTR
jgi:hypothetical protein